MRQRRIRPVPHHPQSRHHQRQPHTLSTRRIPNQRPVTRPPQTLPIPKALLYPTPIPMPSPRHLTRRQVGQHHPRLPPPARPYRQHRTLQSVDPEYPDTALPYACSDTEPSLATPATLRRRLPAPSRRRPSASQGVPPTAESIQTTQANPSPDRSTPTPARRKGRGKGTPPLRPDRVPRWLVPRHRDGALFVKHTEAACALDAEAPEG
jgi:hypothetical protein